MQLEAKGIIRYEPGAKKELVIKAPAIGLEEEVGGVDDPVLTLAELVELLERKIKMKVQEGFARPVEVRLGGFSLGCVFFVEPIANRTLDEFTREHSSEDDDTKITITGPDGKTVETTQKRMALAAELMKKSNETGIPPEEILAAARKKTGIARAGGVEE